MTRERRLAQSVCLISYPVSVDGKTGTEHANGTFISPNHVLTSWHIIERAAGAPIQFTNDNRETTLMVNTPTQDIFHDTAKDLAIVKLMGPIGRNSYISPVTTDTLETEIAHDTLLVAEFQNKVFVEPAVENKNLTQEFRGSSVISEHFSGFATRAPIQPGFSGAPIIDSRDQIVSVLSAAPYSEEDMKEIGPIKPFIAPTPRALAEFTDQFMNTMDSLS